VSGGLVYGLSLKSSITSSVCGARLESRTALALVLALTILQCAFGTSMIGFIVPG
jgi:hypothetical protein